MDLYLDDKEQVVVNEPKDSETPSLLVVESPDQEHPGELSPNPHGFGFSKQKIVDYLPLEGEFNVLYLVKIKSAESGDKVLGYRYFKWNTATRGYELINPTQPQIKDVKSPVSSPIASEEEEKPSFAKIINGNVGIVNGELYINGKKVVIDPYDDQGFKILTLTTESGTLTDEQYQLALSNECAILVAPVYLYKDRNASTLLLYKSHPFVSSDKTYYLEVEITKADKSYVLRQVAVVNEEQINSIAEQAIQADKDIISQIEMAYEEDDSTRITFPKGIMPLSITFNTHDLYFKDFKLVNDNGEEVEGYELDDLYDEEGSMILYISGDITEQIINRLTYINFNGQNIQRINNTYNLFFPQTGGEEVVAYEGTSLLPTDVVFEDWTLHRAIKDGNTLWIVCNGKITNNSSNSVTISQICSITLSSDVSSKIYRFDGTNCSQPYLVEGLVLQHTAVINTSPTITSVLYCDVANVIKLSLGSGQQVSSGNSLRVNIRIPIFLDIGE